MALNKREILPVAKSCTRSLPRVISSCFAKKMLSKILIFLAQNISLSEKKNGHCMFVKIFQVSAD